MTFVRADRSDGAGQARRGWHGLALLALLTANACAGRGPTVDTTPADAHATNEPTSAPEAEAEPAPEIKTATRESHALPFGRRLEIEGTRASVVAADGTVLSTNDHLIRLVDGTANCPSDGLLGVEQLEDGRFAIDQQTCAGWYFYVERLEFRMSADDDSVLLDRVSLATIDRKAEVQDATTRTLGSAELGRIELSEVDLDAIHERVK